MGKKFENVPVEEDTVILFELEGNLGEYKILYQKWYWEGITAESFIFANEDVAERTDEEIIELVLSSPAVKSEKSDITLSRSDSGFTFVNFNFVHDED